MKLIPRKTPPAPVPDGAAIAAAAERWRADLDTAAASRQHLVRTANLACERGMSEVAAARNAGVTRLTLRAWRGKGKKGQANVTT
jgi:hypothetical protein